MLGGDPPGRSGNVPRRRGFGRPGSRGAVGPRAGRGALAAIRRGRPLWRPSPCTGGRCRWGRGSLDMTNPVFVEGVKFHMDGNADAYYVEAGQYQQWDSVQQTWVPKGPVIDLDGQSKNCAWNAAAAVCQ